MKKSAELQLKIWITAPYLTVVNIQHKANDELMPRGNKPEK